MEKGCLKINFGIAFFFSKPLYALKFGTYLKNRIYKHENKTLFTILAPMKPINT